MSRPRAVVDGLEGSGSLDAETIFQAQQDELYRTTDRLFAQLMVVQWIFCVALGLLVAPRTWKGLESTVNPHVWESILLGGAIVSLPIYLGFCRPDFKWTRYVMAVAQMLVSALIIHLTEGRIESHFHVFGSLAFLAFYRDWRVLIPASIVVLVDHFARGILVPLSVFGVSTPDYWRPLEHTGWVVFEGVFLTVSCLRSTREMRLIAENTASLSRTNVALRQEIEERLAAQSALTVSEERYRTVVNSTQEVLFQLDSEFRWTFLNRAWLVLMGSPPDDCLGRPLVNFVHADDRLDLETQLSSVQRGEIETCRVEVRFLGRERQVRWLDVFVRAARDDSGRLAGFSGTLMDVTERRLAEEKMRAARVEAEKANQAKSEFLSRMSHELRTPMNAILGFAQLLERKEMASIQATWVRHILGAGQHLLSLIDEILDVSRIETGQMRLSLEPVRVREVVEEVQHLMGPVAEQHGVKLRPVEWNCQCEYVTADRQRIKQVLLNLISNAVKYNQTGGWVQISISPGSDSGTNLMRLSVTDNGVGIDEDFLERVFVPFDRLGHQNSAVPGTGLGLSLSKYLVEAMGGKIGVVSARGKGCTAWVEIPLSGDPFEGADLDIPLSMEATRPERTLLYIEDNPANLKLVEHLLQAQAGVHLVTASHGALGLELARRHQPDLIILDLHLPDVMGWEILHQLRSDKATKEIPVIVLSADTTASQQSKLLAAGADRYLTKPINASKFLNTLEEVMA